MIEKLHIFVKAGKHGRSIAVEENSRLVEFYQESEREDTLVNAVILGKVDRVMKGLDAAFVKIGQPRSGFLPLNEMESFEEARPDQQLAAGATVTVQVKKDPKGEKGAYLSRDIALPGQAVIFMPYEPPYRRIRAHYGRNAAQNPCGAIGKQLTGGKFGVMMRSVAADHSEAGAPRRAGGPAGAAGTTIQEKAEHAKAPELLYREPIHAVHPRAGLRAALRSEDHLQRPGEPHAGRLRRAIYGSRSATTIAWTRYGPNTTIDAQVRTALGRRVPLKTGGTLTIDEREALTTIDVNSGSFTAGRTRRLPAQSFRPAPRSPRRSGCAIFRGSS